MRRKPEPPRFESWIDRQIREARERGQFDNLEGTGRQIPGLNQPHDDFWWAKKLLQRERLSLLPPALEIRAKVARVLDELNQLSFEQDVRDRVEALNREIASVNRTTSWGPPTTVARLDVEEIVARWRRRT